MQDVILKEIQNKMFDYDVDWKYDKQNKVWAHPTRTFGYGSFSDVIRKHLEEIDLEEIFQDNPKPQWIFYAFRRCDLDILKSFLKLDKAFFLNKGKKPVPLAFQLDNGKFVMIAPMMYDGDISEYKGLPAWLKTDSMLFDIATGNQD